MATLIALVFFHIAQRLFLRIFHTALDEWISITGIWFSGLCKSLQKEINESKSETYHACFYREMHYIVPSLDLITKSKENSKGQKRNSVSTEFRCPCPLFTICHIFIRFSLVLVYANIIWGLALSSVFWCDIWHERLFPWKSCIWCISVSNGKRENGIKSNWYNTWWSEILILIVLMGLVVNVDFISWSS